MKKVAFTLLIAAIGGFVAIGAYKIFEPKNTLSIEEKQQAQYVNLPNTAGILSSTGSLDFTVAAAMVTPAVVHIKTTYSASARGNDPFDAFREFFGGPNNRNRAPQQASGSGVIITSDGYVVTNNHVVENADKIEVVLNDKRSYNAKVIGLDPNTDLAVLKIEEKNLPFVKYGNSDAVKVGEWVLAVGNPFNLTSTVTAGIVSAKGRTIGLLGNANDPNSRPLESFIQTDAAINRGNSGGALVNTNGELIGVNAAIASQTGTYEGYGFAIPINLVKKVVDDLRQFGLVQRGFIGVEIRDVNAELAKEKGLASVRGIFINSVSDGGAAQIAGLKAGDVILKVQGVDVNSMAELQEQIGRYRPGDAVDVLYLRDNRERNVKVVLKNIENKTTIVKREPNEMFDALGGNFAALSDKEKKDLGLQNGVKVTGIRSGQLATTGIREGFIITRVNNSNVDSEAELKSALSKTNNNMVSIEGVYPNNPTARYIYSFSAK